MLIYILNPTPPHNWIPSVKQLSCLTSMEITCGNILTTLSFLFHTLQLPGNLVSKSLRKSQLASILNLGLKISLNVSAMPIPICTAKSRMRPQSSAHSHWSLWWKQKRERKKCHLFKGIGLGWAHRCLINTCNCNAAPYGLAREAQVAKMDLTPAVLYRRTFWYGFLINQWQINGT